MRLKAQYLVAGGVLGVVVLYFAAGALFDGGKAHKQAQAAVRPELPTVQVSLTQPADRPALVAMRGHTQAARIVSVRSETAGVVAATPVREGSFVRQGQVLCKLKVDARQATLDQARANMKARQLTQKASADLAARGFRSPTQLLTDQANLDQASAAVRQAEVALQQTDIRAPFAGVFNQRSIEIGGFLAAGGECGVVMELDPLKIIGNAPETAVGRLRVGAPAHAVLASGERLDGVIYSVGKDADPQTRTYPVVMIARNPGERAAGGLSAQISVDVGRAPAHLAPSSALVLDSAGRQGVRYVNDAGVVGFAPVQVADETPQGVWLTGLSGPVRIITVGQSYVAEGQRVRVASR